MTIHVKLFASLRELIGTDRLELETDAPMTVGEVWARVAGDRSPEVEVLMALNLEYATADETVRDGDEVGFFPPVTGG